MILPGFFLEYLVTGSCALLWIYGLFVLFGQAQRLQIDSARSLLIAPALYVVGMIVDFMSRTALVGMRDRMEEIAEKKEGRGSDRSPMHYADVLARSPDLARQIELRSSRDRIARGAAGNLLLATIVFTIVAARDPGPIAWYVVLPVGLVLVLAAIAMWYRFHRLTNRFARKAAEALLKIPSNK